MSGENSAARGRRTYTLKIAGTQTLELQHVLVGDVWICEAQALAAKNVPHSCLAVTVDTGNADNVHPIEKEPGDRLALCALSEHYGQKVVYSGPTLKRVERLPGEIKLHFERMDEGLWERVQIRTVVGKRAYSHLESYGPRPLRPGRIVLLPNRAQPQSSRRRRVQTRIDP